MTKKNLDANKLLCGNNTVKTHQVNRSDFKKRLGFVDKIFSKKQLFLFQTKLSWYQRVEPSVTWL